VVEAAPIADPSVATAALVKACQQVLHASGADRKRSRSVSRSICSKD
jgi:hypothetical protein